MFDSLFSSIKKGARKIARNPQLIYTVVVATIITVAFIFMAEKFIGIASDAQERLINVRIGALQDAFVSFAGEKVDDKEYLNKRIDEIKENNETIINFRIISKTEDKYVVQASSEREEIGKEDPGISFLYTLASSDPSHSVTMPGSMNEERIFSTARAITNDKNEVTAVVMTVQTLSQADVLIERNIRNGKIVLALIVVLVLFLFLRHSKIIDYIDLYKKLKEVDQLKDDFVSMASHELRTPLTAIRGYAEFVSRAPEISTETKSYAQKIDSSSKDLDTLVADILDVSRIEQGRMSFKIESLDPTKIIEEVVNSLKNIAKEKELEINFDRSRVKDNQIINGDRDRLKQVLINLVGNAVKYTEKGSITVMQYEEKGRLYIRVSDTGLGMTEEERKRLFEKFYRIRNEHTENIRGTGLGLWITDQIVKQMNGSMSVESIKGVGSHFVVSFPIIN